MINLIIEIDGFYQQVLLIGEICTKQQLQQKYRQTKKQARHTREIPDVFCKLYNFKKIPYNINLKVDFVIDSDTDRIYSPFY